MNQQNPSQAEPNPAAAGSMFDLSIDDLKQSITQLLNEPADDDGAPFITHTADHWLEIHDTQPESRELFGKLWFEHELCILFSDTNVGKSILAVQIGDSIANGRGITPFVPKAGKQRVLYFDFELSTRQFGNRYVDEHKKRYFFGDHFQRSALNPCIEVPDGFGTFEEYICFMIAHEVLKTQATVVIIDNITYLRTETERAKDALPLMKQLKALKEKFGLSILALAHTPKRDRSQPINRNDLSGSKMIINFCDSAFSIGESYNDSQVRYLKQIKQRNTEEVYGESNVLVYQITKPGNFLHYDYIGTGSEWEHLKKRSDDDTDELTQQAVQLHEQGLTLRQIGAELNISHTKAKRLIDKVNNPAL